MLLFFCLLRIQRSPTSSPTATVPTPVPTREPTQFPSQVPSTVPSTVPSQLPTSMPSQVPTVSISDHFLKESSVWAVSDSNCFFFIYPTHRRNPVNSRQHSLHCSPLNFHQQFQLQNLLDFLLQSLAKSQQQNQVKYQRAFLR